MKEKIIQDKGLERREGIRYTPRANCFFRCLDKPSYFLEYSVCKVENIGTGGLAFLSEQACKIGSELIFTIALLDQYPQEPIDALGKIIWIKDSEYPYKYKIGVKFINMLKDDLLFLRREINHTFNMSTMVQHPI